MSQTYPQFRDYWSGRNDCDFDHAYDRQCVDLFNFYNRDVVGAPRIGTPLTGGAADLWNAFPTLAQAFYEKVPYAPGVVPSQGWVAIWAANTPVTGAAGHVGMVDSATDHSFISLDQNYPTGSLPHLQAHSYVGVLGFLKPLLTNNEEPEMFSPAQIDELTQIAFNRPATDSEKSTYNTQPIDTVLQEVLTSPENLTLRTKAQNAADLEAELTDAKNWKEHAITELEPQLDAANKTIADLQAKLAARVTSPVIPDAPHLDSLSKPAPVTPVEAPSKTLAQWFLSLFRGNK